MRKRVGAGAIIGAAVLLSWSGSVAGEIPEHRAVPGRMNAEPNRGSWNGTSLRADSSPVTHPLPSPFGPAFPPPGDAGPPSFAAGPPGDAGSPRADVSIRRGGLEVLGSGIASWYRGSRGFVGTMHAAVPGGRWTGKVWGSATVCRREVCVDVDLVDFCLCPDGRVIDLSVEAFRVLGDPRLGLLDVVVYGMKEAKG